MVLVGYALDLQHIVASNIRSKGHFLLRLELPDPMPFEPAQIVPRSLANGGSCQGEPHGVVRCQRNCLHGGRVEGRPEQEDGGGPGTCNPDRGAAEGNGVNGVGAMNQ